MARKKQEKNNEPEELAGDASQAEPLEVEDNEGAQEQSEETGEGEAGLTAEQELQQQIDASREEARIHHDLYLRTLADMENLRKRSQREKEDLAKFGNEMILREILPVLDNLERAVEHADQDNSATGLLEGVKMTLDQFGKVLDKFHVVAIEAIGQEFDPALHQAMGQIETEEYAANVVAQEMQKGYLLNDRLLRPSMVMIAKAPVAEQGAVDNQDTQDVE